MLFCYLPRPTDVRCTGDGSSSIVYTRSYNFNATTLPFSICAVAAFPYPCSCTNRPSRSLKWVSATPIRQICSFLSTVYSSSHFDSLRAPSRFRKQFRFRSNNCCCCFFTSGPSVVSSRFLLRKLLMSLSQNVLSSAHASSHHLNKHLCYSWRPC